ncbi:hypothetical protein [Varibaculum cambriense]|uniref:Uncharacterized protein n=1 Tax=Varibaculum cambriense TaxID=184870 RepID=A0ABX4UPG0_9ACTO|nr:hypothetical protein [Varibaculum cambriense]PMB89425.1 hypothetical protein CJ240_06565 [Varibaculum cambriense]
MQESDETWGEVLRTVHSGNQRVGQVAARVSDIARETIIMRQYASWAPGNFEKMITQSGGDSVRLANIIDGVSDSELEALIAEANALEAQADRLKDSGVDRGEVADSLDRQAREVIANEDARDIEADSELADDLQADSRHARTDSAQAASSSEVVYGSSEHKREVANGLQSSGASKTEAASIADQHAAFGKPIAGRSPDPKQAKGKQVRRVRVRQARRQRATSMSK